MTIKIDLMTKHTDCIVESDGLTYSRTAGSQYLICQLDTPIKNNQYYEYKVLNNGSKNSLMLGLGQNLSGITFSTANTFWVWAYTGNRYPGAISYATTFTTNDIVGISLKDNFVNFYKNGISYGNIAAPIGLYPSLCSGTTSNVTYSGKFHTTYKTIQYLPKGFKPIAESKEKENISSNILLLSSLTKNLTIGFSKGILD